MDGSHFLSNASGIAHNSGCPVLKVVTDGRVGRQTASAVRSWNVACVIVKRL